MMQPVRVLLPALFTIFLWWFTTGLVMIVYGRSRRFIRLFFAGMTLAAAGALWSVWLTRSSTTTAAVYTALLCGVVLWGWQVASYYLDFVTGRQHAQARLPQTVGQRFWAALDTSVYHELAIIAVFVVLLIGVWDSGNRWALYIYTALWLMHSSAKLNVFFGVRNFRIDFLPPHLHHLKALVGKSDSNWLLLFTVTVAPSVALVLYYRGITPGATADVTVGSVVLATMILLGVLEHVLLVLPVPQVIWGWGLRALDDSAELPPAPQLLPERVQG